MLLGRLIVASLLAFPFFRRKIATISNRRRSYILKVTPKLSDFFSPNFTLLSF